ncbi:MAG: NYN domain-containing protein, partial [Geminicoccaceae bacterium]
CAVDSRTDVLVFDARMPPVSEVIEKLERKRKLYSHQQVAPLDIERWLKLIKSGRWEFWGDGAPRPLPYGFKNAFLDALTHSWYGWKEHLGERKIDISDRGRLHQREKGVDARLVIAGCEAAADPKVDWTCLVTNDADYVPLVEHLRSRGKAVYLLSLGNPKCQSGDLKDAVGAQNIIDKVDLYNSFPNEPVPELFRSKPALLPLLCCCALKHLGSQFGGIYEETCDPVKHMDFLKRYDDVLS